MGKYVRSTFILDLCAFLPSVMSKMNPGFAILKNIRLYEVWILYYPAELLVIKLPCVHNDHFADVLNYGVAMMAKIIILIHNMGCLWIYVGSEEFLNFEEGVEPWTIANEDFHGMANIDLIIFANYWVCTVVTTVGYGDYVGSTTLEYYFSILLEFFGFVIFATL